MRELVEDVEGGDMPLWYYTPMHPAARLSPQDAGVLVDWAKSQAAP
jgi:hypothetical protein